MSRIKHITLETATGKARELLNSVKEQMGGVPTMFEPMAQSPIALEAYLNFANSLSQGKLPKKLAEQIAVTVAGINKCDYCASAHTAIGKSIGITDKELSMNLHGDSDDATTRIALKFCNEIIESRGNIDEKSLQTMRSSGFGDDQILEIFGHIALNTFTNYFNRMVQTTIDFKHVNTNN